MGSSAPSDATQGGGIIPLLGALNIGFIVLLVIALGIFIILRALLKSKSPGINQSERLNELQKMKTEVLITKDEFNKKRNKIIGSI